MVFPNNFSFPNRKNNSDLNFLGLAEHKMKANLVFGNPDDTL